MEETEMTERTEWTEELRCDLKPDEVRQKGEALAEKLRDHDRVEAERKSAMDTFKQEQKRIMHEVGELTHDIATRQESRQIRCYEIPDFEANMVSIVRDDTGEVYKSRGMRPEERQTNITDIESARQK